jgi:hypothetical protein
MFFAFPLLLIITALADECHHTPIFTARGNNNTNYWYFIPITYSVQGQCVTFKRNDEVRRIISSNACSGAWCRPGTKWPNNWNCAGSGRSCYEVEHIIPKRHNITALIGCNTNIYGNTVMSYGKWNAAAGDGFLPEKRIGSPITSYTIAPSHVYFLTSTKPKLPKNYVTILPSRPNCILEGSHA